MAVALVGLPGAGKSAVGRRLAQRLQLPFIDSDHVIEDRIGCSIRDYFEREGEASFRDLEQTVISELAAKPHGVVATGGGSVLREVNRTQLHGSFHVIYLRSAPEDLFRRLRHDVKRPLLQVADPLGRLRELYDARDPLYRATAHDVVETGRPTVAMLVNIIVMQLELAGIASPGPEGDLPD
jgi:shikimate kinase